jgi:NAD+ kinase
MKKVGLICKEGAKNHKKYVDKLLKFLSQQNLRAELDERKIKFCDIVIVFGGDGTILKTIQLLNGKEIPVLGVNTGGLGILTQIQPVNLIPAIKKVFEGKYRQEKKSLLKIGINGRAHGFALNEAVIGQGAFARLVNFEILVGKKKYNFCADGIIISTPAGSTAYSYSAGGPILKSSSKKFLVTPICPSQRKFSPTKISNNEKIKISFKRYHNDVEKFGISLDGQKNKFIKTKDKVVIQKATQKAIFLVPSLSER